MSERQHRMKTVISVHLTHTGSTFSMNRRRSRRKHKLCFETETRNKLPLVEFTENKKRHYEHFIQGRPMWLLSGAIPIIRNQED